MGQEKNAENIPFLRSTQPKSTERVPVVELSGFNPKNMVLPFGGSGSWGITKNKKTSGGCSWETWFQSSTEICQNARPPRRRHCQCREVQTGYRSPWRSEQCDQSAQANGIRLQRLWVFCTENQVNFPRKEPVSMEKPSRLCRCVEIRAVGTSLSRYTVKNHLNSDKPLTILVHDAFVLLLILGEKT